MSTFRGGKVKILGLVGSHRKLGNTEVLVREVMRGAAAETNVQETIIRLTDCNLLACKGCMACVLKGEDCRIDDDVPKVFAALEGHDALVLGAPTYVLAPSAPVKALLDRLLVLFPKSENFKGRRAATVAVGGLPDWDPFSVPLLNTFVLMLQYDLAGWLTAYAPGPGQVLLDEGLVRRANLLGRALANPSVNYVSDESERRCTICGEEGFRYLSQQEGNKIGIQCPVCLAKGVISDGKVKMNTAQHRFTEEALTEHFFNWIMRTGEIYFKHRDEIEKRKQRYSQ